MASCPFREGSTHCIWWLTGCTHPQPVPELMSAEEFAETCRECSRVYGQLPRKERAGEEVKA